MKNKLNDYFRVVFEPELLKEIELYGSLVVLEKDDILIDVGTNINTVPLILEGAIKIVREDKNGDEIVLYFLERGDTCAISLNCLKSKKSIIRGIAEKHTEAIYVPILKIEEWMVKYKSWRSFVIESYSSRLDEMMEAIDTLAFMKMDSRIFKYLTDKVKIMRDTTLNTTHQEIATDLNTSRVVVSRLLKQLENENKIVLHRNRIEVLEF